jgi:hypothetical protein
MNTVLMKKMNLIENRRINFRPDRKIDLFPVFLDYDFENKRPRGLSILFDIFYNEFIFKTVNSLTNILEPVFIKKENFFFEHGFFLIDYKKYALSRDIFLSLLENFNADLFYFEQSNYLQLNNLSLKGKSFYILEFL